MIHLKQTIMESLGYLCLLCVIALNSHAVSSQEATSTLSTPPSIVPLTLPSAVISTAPSNLPFFKADYDAIISGVKVQAKREYKALENGLFELSFTANSWLADLTERSRFAWHNTTIKPVFFASTRTILGITDTLQLEVDHSNKRLTRTDEDKIEKLTYVDNSLDRLSFQLQLQQDLLLNKLDLTYKIIHNDTIKNNQFEIVGKEIITTKAGDLETLKIKVVRENTSRVTFIWVATEWHYLLVRLIQIKDDKEQFSIELTGAIVGNVAVSGLQL